MEYSEHLNELAAALVAFHAKAKAPRKDAVNSHIRNKYATLESVLDAVRPVLTECGLVVLQTLGRSRDSQATTLTTLLLHTSGQYLSDTTVIPSSEAKGLSAPQNVGLSVSYMRRYSLLSILNLQAEDNDGELEKPKTARPAGSALPSEAWRDTVRGFLKGPWAEATGSQPSQADVDRLCHTNVGCGWKQLTEAKGVQLIARLREAMAQGEASFAEASKEGE